MDAASQKITALITYLRHTRGRYYNHSGQMVHSDNVFSIVYHGQETLFVADISVLPNLPDLPNRVTVKFYKLNAAMIGASILGANTSAKPEFEVVSDGVLDIQELPNTILITEALSTLGYTASTHYEWASGMCIRINANTKRFD